MIEQPRNAKTTKTAKTRAKKPASRPKSTPGKTATSTAGRTKRKTSRTRKTASARPTLTPEERHRMIEEVAYLRAERRGFPDGSAEQDWLEAEAEVDALLMKTDTRPRR